MNQDRGIVSIVVPVYNVVKYISCCLDSIVNQSYRDIEVILINDGSTDNSRYICDEYANKDSRITVINIPNGGVAKARELGVTRAKGEYIMFADPDDWMPKDAVETLLSELSSKVDIVIGSFTSYFEKSNIYRTKEVSGHICDKYNYLKELLLHTVTRAPWSRLYRRSLFSSDSFPCIKRTQDVPMNIEIACRCNMVKIIPKSTYFYRDNSSTSSMKRFSYNPDYYNSVCEITLDILKRNNLYDNLKSEYAMFAFKFIYRSMRLGFFKSTNPDIICEVNENIERSRLNFKEKLYLLSLGSSSMRGGIKGGYHIFSYLKKIKKPLPISKRRRVAKRVAKRLKSQPTFSS